MDFSKEEYEIFIVLVKKVIQRRLKWLGSRKNPNFKLYNAGKIKAYVDVLDMFTI